MTGRRKRQGLLLGTLLMVLGFICLPTWASGQSDDRSVKLTRIVENEDGSTNDHAPPTATYTAFLNDDRSKILIENVPRWDGGGDNITGSGHFTVQFGNFPDLTTGDSIRVRFTDVDLGQQGSVGAYVDTLPWRDPSQLERLKLTSRELPPKPAGIQIDEREDGAYQISWDSAGDYRYTVYRRDWSDTLTDGQKRNLYVRVAEGLTATSHTDHPPESDTEYTYIVYARNEAGTWSGHSRPVSQETRLLTSVPRPIIPSRPILVDMYDKSWSLALQNSRRAQPGSGFVDWYLDEAFDNRLFQWDVAFMMTFAKYAQGALPSIETLDNFYRKQHSDGAICGVLQEWDGEDNEPKTSPFFTRNNLYSWAEWEYYQATGDSSRFERVIPILADYARWIQNNRRRDNGHFWWSGFGSGMDNSPRSTATRDYPPHSWVDYDANEAMAARYLVKMARVTGNQPVVDEFTRFRDTMETLVNRDMWSEQDQFYWDLDRDGSFMEIQHGDTGPTRKVMTVASFWPLWADITGEEQVEGLVSHLNNEREFNRPHRVPTLAADDPAYSAGGIYWQGSVWPPTNHMIVEGLMTQGRVELAREIVVNHLNRVGEVFDNTGTVWENYAPESASPGSSSQGDFVGWSGVGPIAQLIENYIGIIPDVPERTIQWNLLTRREVGLRNLEMGDFTITEIRAKRRETREDPPELIIDTPESFQLDLYDGRVDTTIQVEPGQSEIVVTAIHDREGENPFRYRLEPNYPNPFNPETNIEFAVPRLTDVTLTIYNAIGQKVRTLVDRKIPAGVHTVSFNGKGLSSGVYLYRLQTPEQMLVRKMMLLK